jgi:muramoyltetrapeptide carboxypeptidase LdcA involved in peptidoglycan recycling
MPSLKNSILFLEDDEEIIPSLFDRWLQSIIHLPEFKYVQWIVIWRFQKKSHMSKDILTKIIKAKKELNNIPIIANVDFWHTNPLITFPIWWTAQLKIKNNKISLKIIKH